MTRKTPVSVPEPRLVEVLVAPGAVPTELAAAIDCLRIANRVSGSELFRWTVVSANGRPSIACLGGLEVTAVPLPKATVAPDLLIVPGGSGVSDCIRDILPRVQRALRRGTTVLAMSDAAQALLVSGVTDRAAVHWETRALLEEEGLGTNCAPVIFLRQGKLVTSAGMASSFDAMITLVAELCSPQISGVVARVLLLERFRVGSAEQPLGIGITSSLPDGPLRTALTIMEGNMEKPLSTHEIARSIDVSPRQMERLFARYLNASPNRHYVQIRLHKARTLIEGSRLSLIEIALACGFESHSHFSRIFKRRYGVSPYDMRSRLLSQ